VVLHVPVQVAIDQAEQQQDVRPRGGEVGVQQRFVVGHSVPEHVEFSHGAVDDRPVQCDGPVPAMPAMNPQRR
jgi:hypothetical protein